MGGLEHEPVPISDFSGFGLLSPGEPALSQDKKACEQRDQG
jgi:hypothetical protein